MMYPNNIVMGRCLFSNCLNIMKMENIRLNNVKHMG